MYKRKILFVVLALVLSFSLIPVDYNAYAENESLSTIDHAKGSSPETSNATTSEAKKEAEVVSESSADPKSQETDLITDSNKSTTSENEEKSSSLEIGEDSIPLPVGGGSSGGGFLWRWWRQILCHWLLHQTNI